VIVSKRYLSGAFAEANLSGADLSGATLSGALLYVTDFFSTPERVTATVLALSTIFLWLSTRRLWRVTRIAAEHIPHAAGRYWLRYPNGKLQQVRKHPLDLFNLRDAGVRWQIGPR